MMKGCGPDLLKIYQLGQSEREWRRRDKKNNPKQTAMSHKIPYILIYIIQNKVVQTQLQYMMTSCRTGEYYTMQLHMTSEAGLCTHEPNQVVGVPLLISDHLYMNLIAERYPRGYLV